MQSKQEYQRAWAKANREKCRAYTAKWKAEHPTEHKISSRKYSKKQYEKNREQIIQQHLIRYHTKIKKKKPLSPAQLQCIREAVVYDQMRHVSSYSHVD